MSAVAAGGARGWRSMVELEKLSQPCRSKANGSSMYNAQNSNIPPDRQGGEVVHTEGVFISNAQSAQETLLDTVDGSKH